MTRRVVLVAVVAILLFETPLTISGQTPAGSWTQWGGPSRNFISESKGLVSAWPSGGPKKLWSRDLGQGHSSILVESGRLYTMYRQVQPGKHEEVVAAFDAATGKTIWEFRYAAPTDGIDFSEGLGPHATPLIVGNRLFATSSRSELFALDKTTGKRIWSHDFIKEFRAPPMGRGYSCSPILYNGNIIVTMGGAEQGVAAFNQQTGALVWKSGYFVMAPASPILIDVDGQAQLVVFAGNIVAGMDPRNGNSLWSHPHNTSWGLNISTPVWSAHDHLLFVSSAYSAGTRAIELRQTAGKTAVIEKWFTNRMRVHIGTVIRLGDYAYGSSGDFGPAFISAIDMKSGKIAWQDRSFARAQLLYADDKLIILDEDGVLGLATISPQGLKVLARANVLDHLSWTPPTLSGTTLYVRDRKTMAAFELGG